MSQAKQKRMLKALREAARVASVMVDGDEASRIITDRALHYIANPDPEFRFLAGDFFDVDHATFLRMKKTLMRLEQLLPFPCNTALWLTVKEQEDHVTVAVQNGSMHRYYRFGETKRPLEPEMAECLRTGACVEAPGDHPSGTLTLLAPVKNSLGDAVGLVELTSMDPVSKELTPAWS